MIANESSQPQSAENIKAASKAAIVRQSMVADAQLGNLLD